LPEFESVVPAEPALVTPALPATPALPRLSGRELKALAVTGGFAVDDNTGNRMIEALESTIQTLESRWAELEKLRHNPPMSESPAARWVSQHMVRTAADEEGLLTQLQAARAEFPTYVEAIELAKRTYQETEEGNRLKFTSISGEE
jgi:hypothetical protein